MKNVQQNYGLLTHQHPKFWKETPGSNSSVCQAPPLHPQATLLYTHNAHTRYNTPLSLLPWLRESHILTSTHRLLTLSYFYGGHTRMGYSVWGQSWPQLLCSGPDLRSNQSPLCRSVACSSSKFLAFQVGAWTTASASPVVV